MNTEKTNDQLSKEIQKFKFKKKKKAQQEKKPFKSQTTTKEFSLIELKNFYFLADRIANQNYVDVLQTFQDLKTHQDTMNELKQKLKYTESKKLTNDEISVLKKVVDIMTGTKEKILEDKNLFTEKENDILYELKYKLRPLVIVPQKQKKRF